MVKKVRPTLEEHIKIGAQLHEVDRVLSDLWVFLCNSYPKNSPVYNQIRRTVRELGNLKCALDDAVFKEHPEKHDNPEFLNHIYY